MFPGTHAERLADKTAVVMAGSGISRTYRQLEDNSARLAAALHKAGLRRGDVVALLTDNRVEALEVYWAAMRSGLYFTPVNRHLKANEVAYIVNDSDARALLVSDALRDLAEEVVPLTPHVVLRLAIGEGDVAGHQDYASALRDAEPQYGDQPRGAEMFYSSGTTGHPKGIKTVLPELQVSETGSPNLAIFRDRYGMGEQTILLTCAPYYHAAPVRWTEMAVALGGTVVMMESFDAAGALEAIERFGVTLTQMVPTMFIRMLKLPDEVRSRYDISSLTTVVHAGAPCPVDVKRRMLEWMGPIVHEFYSASEMNGGTFIGPEEWLQHPGSVGRPDTWPAHICDDEGRELPAGEPGLIYFENNNRQFEYHNDLEKTEAARHPLHPTWTSVGDVGFLDDAGYLYLTDRKAFMIISGGVNIYPQEVENALALHPKVHDVAVIGVPDEDMGEQVKALVQVADGVVENEETAAELIAHVRSRIAHYKAPRSVEFVSTLPRTPTGKLAKSELMRKYARAAALRA